MGTRQTPGTRGRRTRARRSIAVVAALGLSLLAVFAMRPHTTDALTMPSVTVSVPGGSSVTVPGVTTPSVTVPGVTVPSVTVPGVTVPGVTVPSVTVPSVTVPSVTVPSVPSATAAPVAPEPAASVPGTGSGSQVVSGAASRSVPSTAQSGAPTVSTSARTSAGSSNGASSIASRLVSGSNVAVPKRGQVGGTPRRTTRDRERGPQRLSQDQLERLVLQLGGCLSSVTPHQRQLLTLRSGFGLEAPYSGAQAARILRITPGRERQLEQAAVTSLERASRRGICAFGSASLSAIATAVVSAPFEIVQRALGAGQSPAASVSSASQPVASQESTSSRPRHPDPTHGSAKHPGGNAVASASKGAVISTPGGGGLSWLLLVAAIGALAVAGVVVLVLDRLQPESGPAITLPTWRPRRPRLSPLVGALGAVPLLTRRAMPRSRSHDGQAADELARALEPLATELVEPPAAPAIADDARLADATSAFALATRLERKHDLPGAQDAYRRADELGHPDAAFNLGGILAECGDFGGAQALYRRADELGHAAGAFNLGVLLEHENDLAAAEAAYRRSDERGNALAAFNLGVLLHDRGDFAGAEAAYRRADERGDADGAYSLGNMLAENGDLAGAAHAFDRADARGHAAGAFNLGVLLEERGDLASAEAAYRRAHEGGHGEVADMARAALVELGYRG
jgi:TPR repeat protein